MVMSGLVMSPMQLSVFLYYVCMVMSGRVRSLMLLSVFLCVLCVYGDVSSGQESDASICIYVCIMCVW